MLTSIANKVKKAAKVTNIATGPVGVSTWERLLNYIEDYVGYASPTIFIYKYLKVFGE